MQCYSCSNTLSPTGDRRPVAVCRHHVCLTCFSLRNRCPVCNETSEEATEDIIDQDLIEDLQARNSSASSSNVYKCGEHTSRAIGYYCSHDKALLCGSCAWQGQHLDHKEEVVPYPWDTYQTDVKKMLTVVENVENECRDVREKLENTHKHPPGDVLMKSSGFIDRQASDIAELEMAFRPFTTPPTGLHESNLIKNEELRHITNCFGPRTKFRLVFQRSRDCPGGQDSVSTAYNLCKDIENTFILISGAPGKFGIFLSTKWSSSSNSWIHPTGKEFVISFELTSKLSARSIFCSQLFCAPHALIFGSQKDSVFDIVLNNSNMCALKNFGTGPMGPTGRTFQPNWNPFSKGLESFQRSTGRYLLSQLNGAL